MAKGKASGVVMGGLAATHRRWHAARGQPNQKCPLCRSQQHQPPKRKIILGEKEIAALRQLVERAEILTAFVRDLLGGER